MLNLGIVLGHVLELIATEHSDYLIVEESSNPGHPTKVACEFYGDRNKALLKGIAPGDLVRAQGEVRSREYQEKWYTSFSCYKVVVIGTGTKRVPPSRNEPPPRMNDDIPF